MVDVQTRQNIVKISSVLEQAIIQDIPRIHAVVGTPEEIVETARVVPQVSQVQEQIVVVAKAAP